MSESIKRYFIYFSYNGKNYCGWQRQPNGVSVQQKLEEALSLLLRREVAVVGAGRTDAGVHAKKMIAHFDSDAALDESFLTDKLNRILPKDIAVYEMKEVRSDAHARFDAIARTYHYIVATRKDPFDFELSYRFPGKLDFQLMNEAARVLFDYIDFTSFSKLHTDAKTNNCTIYEAYWSELSDGKWRFTIKANRFLRNMVRAIVGTLLDVGRGKLTLEGFREVIERKDRCAAGSSVPGEALYLVDVEYPNDLFVYK